jgi:predicted Zn-dependent protease
MSDAGSKLKGLAWLFAACVTGLAFAFGLSPMAHVIPFRWESKIAYVLDSDISQTCSGNPQSRALLARLVQRIYPLDADDKLFTIDVEIVRNPNINAYAQLGGKITVYSGLLKQAQSAEELAGILSHEIGHVENRHIMQGFITHLFTAEGISMVFSGDTSSMKDWTHYFLNMSFTRSQETQADEAGLERLQNAHVDNRGFRQFFERMETSHAAAAFLSDHPSNDARIAMAESFDNQNVTPIMTPEEWGVLKHYCGE